MSIRKPTDDPRAGGDTLPAGETPPRPVATEAAPVRAAPPPALEEVDPSRYLRQQVVARGGMGTIVAAMDRRLGRTIALKELHVDQPGLRARFEREALLTARLQHPAIVSVHEAGRWPGGAPFFAMKLVAGRSLDAAIAAAPTLADRLALLPHVIAVADALAYAHGQRIIHRDLKPHNVMVGDLGETVVIDWGLGKDLADAPPGGATDLAHGSRLVPAAPGETAAGEVLGTPAYMPPEQAAGLPVDERADVFAIGAMLDHLLAGAPPDVTFDPRRPPAERLGVPTPLAERQPGLPPELLAIVARATAREPAGRYRTARELAEDLRRFQTGQLVGAHRYSAGQLARRWLARHRAVVTLTSVMLVAAIVLGALSVRRIVREQAAAEAARRRAEASRAEALARRADAEELMSFMLFELKDRLQPLNRLDLLASVAQRAARYYEARPEGDDERDRRLRAAVLRNLGDVVATQGDSAAALAAYRAALARTRSLAELHPDDDEVLHDLAASHNLVGDMQLQQGDRAGALASYREGLAVAEATLARAPTGRRARRDVTVSLNKLGDALRTGGAGDEAEAAYQRAFELRRALADEQPDDLEAQRDLAVSHEKLGGVLLARKDPGALAAFHASLAVRERLVARAPDDAGWRRDLALGHDKVGDAQLRQGDRAGAAASARAALVLRAALAEEDPTNTTLQRELAANHDRAGDLLFEQGDAAGALVAYRQAMEIAARLAARDPANATWQRDLEVSHNKVGDALLERGDGGAAAAAYSAALGIAERLAARDPANATWQRDLWVCHYKLGDARLAAGRRAEAERSYRAALELAQALAARSPDDAGAQEEAAIVRQTLADCCAPPR